MFKACISLPMPRKSSPKRKTTRSRKQNQSTRTHQNGNIVLENCKSSKSFCVTTSFSFVAILGGICLSSIRNVPGIIQNINQTNEISTNSSFLSGDDRSVSPVCNLYVAKSTLKDSGLGIFTTAAIKLGEEVKPADIVIQLTDPNQHFLPSINVLLYQYVWDASDTGGQYEGINVFSLVPGLGMLLNGHRRRNNLKEGCGSTVDTAGLHRSFHPGAGANTYYWNYPFYATKDVSPGSELLVDYGIHWFKERKRKGILSTTVDDDNISSTSSNFTRSVDWIRNNGICLDNIKVEQSTNPEAGRGAFATRSMPKGEIVAPAPVVQITDRRGLAMFKVKSDPLGGDVVEGSDQLLLNYCYGHPNSSILLFPIVRTQ